VLVIGSTVEFVQGWAASVVKLGAAVAADIGGLLDGQLAWDGYRWMRDSGVRKEFWNGAAWVRLPPGFRLTDANNFCVGFYKHGAGYTCQYGGIWPTPGTFAEWNINDVLNRQKISAWENNIGSTWTRKFFIKRKSCPSRDVACCRFSTEAAVSFQRNDAFREGLLIIAAGNIRSNDSLFFLGEDRLAMAAHEFGHHLGNPDEYAGASLEVTLNGDGAVNGIDTDSIMGQNLTKVKKRHYRTICKHLASMVKDEKGRDFEYEAIAT
jgi:hypothetical protein